MRQQSYLPHGERMYLDEERNAETPTTRTTWSVQTSPSSSESGYAMIEAYERPDGQTRVDFIDGTYLMAGLRRKEIGDAFWEFTQFVIEHHGMANVAPDTQRNRPGAKTDALYDEAYAKICQNEMTQSQACGWFIAKSGIEKPDRQAKDNFAEAMRRRRNKEKTGKK